MLARQRIALLGVVVAIAPVAPIAIAAVPASGPAPASHRVATAPVTGPPAAGVRMTARLGSPHATLRTTVRAPRGPVGVRGWIRMRGAAPAVAVVRAGGRDSAPLHLTAGWQRFGITGLTAAGSGTLRVSVTAAPGTAWRPGSTVEVAGVAATGTAPSVTRRVAGTREVTLTKSGGQSAVFNGQGFTYNPTPPGTPFYYSANLPQTCQADASLMGPAGVNLVAIPFEGSPVNAEPLHQCLDALWAQNIGVAWLVQPTANDWAAGDAWTLEAEQDLRAAVTLVGAHPATYFWLIGNEINDRGGGATGAGRCFFTGVGGSCGVPQTLSPNGQLDALASFVKSLDGAHLVGTKIAGVDGQVITTNDVPALDFWGVDAYPDQRFGTALSTLKSDDPTRPALMTEFGNDRYRCDTPLYVTNPNNGQHLGFACSYARSHEDSTDQIATNTTLWYDPSGGDSILADDATAASPDGAVFGGTEFMYQDLWWFGYYCGAGATHDICPAPFPSHGDSTMEIEWAGVTYAQLASQAGQPRTTTPTFTKLAETWSTTPSAFPEVSGVTISKAGTCTFRVGWSTPVASNSRVDYGKQNLVGTNGSGATDQIVEDNTLYTLSATNAAETAVTQHNVSLTLAPGAIYRLVARSFDGVGRTGASDPVNLQVTPASPATNGCTASVV